MLSVLENGTPFRIRRRPLMLLKQIHNSIEHLMRPHALKWTAATLVWGRSVAALAVTTDSAGILIILQERVTDNELQLSDGRPMLSL